MWSWLTRWIRRRSDYDFAAEVESHIAMEVDRLVRNGLSPEEAAFVARRAFGNPTLVQEELREARPQTGLEWLVQDVRHGLRSMRRTPSFTAIAVASLAIGIGANTTTFGVIDSLLLRTPAHVADASRIRRVYFAMPRPGGDAEPITSAGYGTYEAIRDHVSDFESVGAFWANKVSSGRGLDARSIDAVLVTPSVFTLLGVRPAVGRFFAPDEERDDQAHVAILGYEAWRSWFGAEDVLGHKIDVTGTPYTIVGVAPEGFTGIDMNRVDLWLPLGAAKKIMEPHIIDPGRGGYWLSMVAKLRDSVPDSRVSAQTTQIFRDLFRNSPRFDQTFGKSHVVLGPITEALGPAPNADAKIAEWVAGVSLVVLLIACANVATLLLLRGLSRSRDTALRLSLGATRGRLMRQALVEGGLLVVAGAICALLIAHWTATAMRAFLLPHASTTSAINGRLLSFTAVVVLSTALLAALLPAIATARRDFGPLLGSGRPAGAASRLVLQRTLIGVQVALAMLLLVGAGLFVASLRNVHAIDLGIDVDHVLYVEAAFPAHRKPDTTATGDVLYRAILNRVRQVPGVMKASLTSGAAVAGGTAISLRQRGGPPMRNGMSVPFERSVGSDYFETMGTRLVRGRFFTAADHVPGALVAIVDESVAKQYLPDGNGLDPCVYLGDRTECTQIVGVVENSLLWRMTGDKGSIVYLPIEAWPMPVTMIEVRTLEDPAKLIPVLRQAALSVSPELPWVDITPLSQRLAPQLRPWRLGASMFSAFGALALCLAAVGLYGLLSYIVAQQSHEIGIRRALGAPASGVIMLVLRRGLATTLVGCATGLAIALGSGKLIATQLYGVSPRDPMVISVCAAVLVGVAIAAGLVPARRATRIDPNAILRAE